MRGSYRKTPVTDRTFDSLSQSEAQILADRDARQLSLERSLRNPEIAAKITEPAHSIKKMMQEWERLVNALEAQWEIEGYFLLDDYLFALDMRSSLEERINDASPDSLASIVDALRNLDARFLEQTVREKPGEEGQLRPWLKPVAGRPPEWLWDRRPRIMPW